LSGLFQDAGILEEFLDEQRFTADERDTPDRAARQAVSYLEPFGVRELVGKRTIEAAMGAAEVARQGNRPRCEDRTLCPQPRHLDTCNIARQRHHRCAQIAQRYARRGGIELGSSHVRLADSCTEAARPATGFWASGSAGRRGNHSRCRPSSPNNPCSSVESAPYALFRDELSSTALAAAMRCAFAISVSVMFVAGIVGNTLESIRWTRARPIGRPSRSLSRTPGSRRMGKAPPEW